MGSMCGDEYLGLGRVSTSAKDRCCNTSCGLVSQMEEIASCTSNPGSKLHVVGIKEFG